MLRGTKQGDPISLPLFNAVLEMLMRKLKAKWSRKNWGIYVGSDEIDRYLQNLRFADDLLLLAPSLQGAQKMLKDLVKEGAS